MDQILLTGNYEVTPENLEHILQDFIEMENSITFIEDPLWKGDKLSIEISSRGDYDIFLSDNRIGFITIQPLNMLKSNIGILVDPRVNPDKPGWKMMHRLTSFIYRAIANQEQEEEKVEKKELAIGKDKQQLPEEIEAVEWLEYTPEQQRNIDEACKAWVNRGYPRMNMTNFLEDFFKNKNIYLTSG